MREWKTQAIHDAEATLFWSIEQEPGLPIKLSLGVSSGTPPPMKSIGDATLLISDLAKLLFEAMRSMNKPWRRAFVRFEMTEEDSCGCSGSYETPEGVEIYCALTNGKQLFDHVNKLGLQLREALSNDGGKLCVFLLTVDSDLNFDVQFEKVDVDRWKITKLNGASGIPNGVQ